MMVFQVFACFYSIKMKILVVYCFIKSLHFVGFNFFNLKKSLVNNEKAIDSSLYLNECG